MCAKVAGNKETTHECPNTYLKICQGMNYFQIIKSVIYFTRALISFPQKNGISLIVTFALPEFELIVKVTNEIKTSITRIRYLIFMRRMLQSINKMRSICTNPNMTAGALVYVIINWVLIVC